MNAKWIRVSRRRRCEICDHPDWCTYSPDLGMVLCMRVESGRPSTNSMGGWIHKVSDPRPSFSPPIRLAIKEAPPDLETLWSRWSRDTDPYHVDGFAMSLGVSTDSLQAIGCAWNGRAWAFPMKDATGKMIGIRLRSEGGDKYAVRGSRQGLFFPSEQQNAQTLFIAEGPTDCAAALTLGLNALGRPACIGQEPEILSYVRRVRASRVVIVSDNDEPGLRGAAKLQAMLPVMNCLWVPPAKDIRQFVSLGGDRETLEASIKDLVWTRPRAIAA